MAATLMGQNFIGARDRLVEILCAVNRQNERQFLPGEGEVAADTGFLHHKELLAFSGSRQTASTCKNVGVASNQGAAQLAVRPLRRLDFCFFGTRRLIAPARSSAAMALSYIASTRMTEFSDEHDVELSKSWTRRFFQPRRRDLLSHQQ